MADTTYLDWPFFDAHHPQLARAVDAWAREHLPADHPEDIDSECRRLVRELGRDG